MAGYI